MKPTTVQYLFDIEHANGRKSREWFTPSSSLRTDEDTDLDAAHLAAREWHDDAKFISPVRDNRGKAVTR